jgi:hypothetical protein
MGKVYAGARALALLVAIIAAFVTVPQLATVLLILGGVSAIGNKPEDNVRVYLVATVFTVASTNLGGFMSVGPDLAKIFANIGVAATGAAAVAVVMALVNMTMAAFGTAGQPAMKPAAAS